MTRAIRLGSYAIMIAILGSLLSLPSAAAQGPPRCPTDVAVEATSEGNLLTWWHGEEPGDAGDEFRIYRALEDATPVDGRPGPGDGYAQIATVPDGERSFLDTDVEAGVTYSYIVTFYDGVESFDCEPVSVTAVPFFGGILGIGLAALGGVGIVAMMRRRT